MGRIGNFINLELWGRETDVPWAMIFPNDPLLLPRHPSQLYEAFLEGFVLLESFLGIMTRGQALCLPMIIGGGLIMAWAYNRAKSAVHQ